MASPIRILLVEDDKIDQMAFERLVNAKMLSYDYTIANTLSEAREVLAKKEHDVIVADYLLGDGTALDLVGQTEDIPIIVITGSGDEEVAVTAMKGGASDYLTKDPAGNYLKTLPLVVEAAITHKRAEIELRDYRVRLEELVAERTFQLTQVNEQLKDEIVERKQTEKALRKSEQAFQDLLNTITDYVWNARIEDDHIVYNYYSSVVERITGYPPEYFMDSSEAWLSIIHPEDRAQARRDLDREYAGEVVTHEYRIIRPDGEIRWLHGTTSPTFDQQGKVIGLSGIVSDITERKLAEEAVKASEEKYRTLFENSGLSIIIYDRAGKILLINNVAAQFFDSTPQTLIGQRLHDLLPSTVADEYLRRIQTVMKTSQEDLSEDRLQTAEGEVWFLTSTHPLRDEEGNVTSVQVIAHNTTERKQLAEQLRQAQKMEAIGQLTAGIAHDFNNLLTVINGFAELLEFELAQNPAQQESVRKILHAGQRGAELVRKLLAFSREQAIEPHLININHIVSEMNKVLQRTIGENIDLEIRLDSNLWYIRIDPTQIEQIIVNLVVNARDVMPHGGKIVIETANVTLDEDFVTTHVEAQPGDHVRLTVTDTGPGMSEAIKAHIFEPFYTTKEVGKGTGLGLSIVYGIVKQNQGHIGVFTEVGLGTTFKIYIPRADLPT